MCFINWRLVLLFLQVARAGRFGTKGLAVTFVSDETDAKILNDVQDRFEVNVAELPEEIDISSYSKNHTVSNMYNDLQMLQLLGMHWSFCGCIISLDWF